LGKVNGFALLGLLMFVSLAIPATSQNDPNISADSPRKPLPERFLAVPRSLITERIDRSRTVPTQGAVHPDVTASRDLGPVDDSMLIDHLQLVLRRTSERQAAFDSFVDALHQADSDVYHHWLTPDEIGTEFGPSTVDIESIRNYLESEGFKVNRVGKSGMFVDFAGNAAQVERAFHTEIHNLITSDGRHRFSAVKGASVPESLAPIVVGFVSMSNVEPQPAVRIGVAQDQPVRVRPEDTMPSPCSSGACDYYVGPQDFYTIYNEQPLITPVKINGSGVKIALIEQSDIHLNDVSVFRTMFHVSPDTPTITLNTGYTMQGSTTQWCEDPGYIIPKGPGTPNDEQEAVLDAEWAGAVAPGAELLVMSCKGAGMAGVLLSAEAVIDDNLAPILSLSYIVAEQSGSTFPATISTLWEQAAAQGQTVVVCAGDTGSAANVAGKHQEIASSGIAVNAYASTAYNVAAGGTDFQDTYNLHMNPSTTFGPSGLWNIVNAPGRSSARSYIPETTWNDSCADSLLAAFSNLSPNQLCDTYPSDQSSLTPNVNMGGSGGVSMFNARPSWQNQTVYGLPEPIAPYKGRLLPDISFFASDGNFPSSDGPTGWGHKLRSYESDYSASLLSGGGTSFVAPQVAGIFALIEQKTGTRLGQPDYVLYSLAGTEYGTSTFSGADCNGSGAADNTGTTSSLPSGDCIFYDIVTGNNSQQCAAGSPYCYSDGASNNGILSSTNPATAQEGYAAGQGYDLATGIGSANITNLVNAWPIPTFSLTISPGSLNIAAGQSAMAIVKVVPGNGFRSQVNFGCIGLPSEARCSFSPISITPNGAASTCELRIITTSANTARSRSEASQSQALALLFPGLAIGLAIIRRRSGGSRGIRLFCPLIILIAGLTLPGCAHHPDPGTPIGTYTVTVSGYPSGPGGVSQSTTLSVTVPN